jgi:methionyl-tRNA synthetase
VRSVEILVLPLEKYRSQIEAYYAARQGSMRPHVLRLVSEMLSKRLPDFPLSYPASWGVPIPIEGFDGQVLNVWAEMFPGLLYMTDVAHSGKPGKIVDGPWSENSDFEPVQFLGYDNTFYFAFVHLCLAFAHGGMTNPLAIVTNEFYFLEGSKFSTSRRHLIWARDLLAEYGADEVRFFLALDNPEHQSTNFSTEAFRGVVDEKLFDPLDEIAALVRDFVGQPTPQLDAREETILNHYSERMIRAYDPSSFSMRQAAETTSNLLSMAEQRSKTSPGFGVRAVERIGELAAPLIPGLAGRISERFDSAAGKVPDLAGLRG